MTREAITVADADAMRRLGRVLGEALAGFQDRPVVVALNGELGAGKTTFVGGVLAGAGMSGAVRSPTYTLIEPYEAGGAAGQRLYHLDLYRLAGPGELEALGVRDLHVPGSVLLVEWAARGGAALPPADLILEFHYAEAADGSISPRCIEAFAATDAGHALKSRLAQGSA